MKTLVKEIDPPSEAPHHDLKGRMARGALASIAGQGTNFVLRLGSMMVLARLLSPRDFGLVGMATAVTGFLILFQDFGLSAAAVQSPSISRVQSSTLFWINLAIGGFLALFCAALAPPLANFYHQPPGKWFTILPSTGLPFTGATGLHRSLVSRNHRL